MWRKRLFEPLPVARYEAGAIALLALPTVWEWIAQGGQDALSHQWLWLILHVLMAAGGVAIVWQLGATAIRRARLSVDAHVWNLHPIGSEEWVADIEVPQFNARWADVTLRGRTQRDVEQSARAFVEDWWLGHNPRGPSSHLTETAERER